MKRPSGFEILFGFGMGTLLFLGICLALSSLTYSAKGKASDKPYFVYQGY